jgi:hypothetical protein
MMFLWVLTWFSYWIFLKQQINAVNIIGASISAGLLLFSYFLPVRNNPPKTPTPAESEMGINHLLESKSIGFEINLKEQIPPKNQATLMQWFCLDKVEEFREQSTVLEPLEQVPKSVDLPHELECAVQEPKSVELSQEPESVELAQESGSVELAKEPESLELADESQSAPKKGKKNRSKRKPVDLQSKAEIQISPQALTTPIQSPCFDEVEELLEQPTLPETQEHEPKSVESVTQPESVELVTESESKESAKEPEFIELAQQSDSAGLADKLQQSASKSSGCPKNLDYYTKKPRPKQTPEECFTCEKLIACVCLTDT